jgi:hypothetical protein
MSTLYAWATPAFTPGFIWDHTWVTDYDNRLVSHNDIPTVVAVGNRNWYCWGDYHKVGGTPSLPDGFVGGADGHIATAVCICAPNLVSKGNPSAQGTIFGYGYHGVCHQLANQVLFATRSKIKVGYARGYQGTSALYGDYGINRTAWDQKKSGCLAKAQHFVGHSSPARGIDMRSEDSFEKKSMEVLHKSDDGHKLSKLLKLRRQHQEKLSHLAESVQNEEMKMLSAQELNALNDMFFEQAADLLGPIDFQTIFGFPPGTKTNFVQQEILGV